MVLRPVIFSFWLVGGALLQNGWGALRGGAPRFCGISLPGILSSHRGEPKSGNAELLLQRRIARSRPQSSDAPMFLADTLLPLPLGT